MARKAVDVVIVNWNSRSLLRECIASIFEYEDGFVRTIVVVDNGSTDGSCNRLPDGAVPVQVIPMGRNLGFARACNIGTREGNTEFVLFLNPDARLMAGTLNKVVSYLSGRESQRIGICGVRLLSGTGQVHRHCSRFPTPKTYFGHSTGLGALCPRLFPSHFMREFDHMTSRKVDHVIGAFFLVRRKAFVELGGFDERFFMYLEDIDFSHRAAAAGWASWYLAEAIAFHRGGGTSEQAKAHRLFYSLRSRILYAFKHFSRGQAWLVTASTVIVEPLTRMVRAVVRQSFREAVDLVKAYLLLWGDLRNILRRAGYGRPIGRVSCAGRGAEEEL